jgi:5-methylcytosine-specific restriction endonuclease McrA
MSRPSLPDDEYAALKLYVLRRDQWRCRACRFRCNLQVHHVIFRSQQGPDTPENLATLCNDCHDKIHIHGTLVVVGDNADIPGGMKFLRVLK